MAAHVPASVRTKAKADRMPDLRRGIAMMRFKTVYQGVGGASYGCQLAAEQVKSESGMS